MDSVVNLIFKTVGGSQLDKAAQQLDKVNNTIKKTNGNLPGVGKGFGGVGKSAQGAVGGVRAFGASLAAALGPIIGITSAVAALGKALNTSFERGKSEQRLKNLSKTAGDFEYSMAAAREASEKFGFTLTQAQQQFGDAQARLGTLGYNVKQVNEVFTGFNVIARESGASADAAQRAFLQLSQGMGAGALKGDELNSILENMPMLAAALAEEMNQPVAKIKQLGSEGKITTDIIYNAMKKAADSAGDLDDKLTPTEKALNKLKQTAENAFAAFGKYLEPIIVPALNAASKGVEMFSQVWTYITQKIFPEVAEAFMPVMDAFRELFEGFDWNLLKNLVVNALLTPMQVLAGVLKNIAPAFTWIVDRLNDIAKDPIIQTLIGAVGGLLQKLGLLSDPVGEFNKGLEKANKTTAELEGGISKPAEDMKKAAEQAVKLAEAQKSAAAEAIKGAEAAEALRQNNLKLLSAEFGLQQTLLDIEAQKAQRALENAKTNEQVVAAANKIFKIAVEQAKLDRDIAKLKNKSAVEELAQKVRIIQATKAQAEAERAVLVAKGEATEKIDQQLGKLGQEIAMTEKSLQVQKRIAAVQDKQIEAVFKQAVETAKITREKNIQEGKERLSNELNKEKTEILERSDIRDCQAKCSATTASACCPFA